MHGSRVVPASALDVVADPIRRAGGQGQPGTAWPPVQIENDVIPLGPEPSCESQIAHHPREPSRPRHDNHVGQVRVASNDRSRIVFHEIRQASVRERPLHGR